MGREVWRLELLGSIPREQRLGSGSVGRSAGDVRRGDQSVESRTPPLASSPGGDQRRIARRGSREAREKGGLTQTDLGCRCREIECGGGLDTDGSLAQRHAIQVVLENRLLGKVALEPERPEHLRELAVPAPGSAAQDTRKLHGDGRAAGDDAARAKID